MCQFLKFTYLNHHITINILILSLIFLSGCGSSNHKNLELTDTGLSTRMEAVGRQLCVQGSRRRRVHIKYAPCRFLKAGRGLKLVQRINSNSERTP